MHTHTSIYIHAHITFTETALLDVANFYLFIHYCKSHPLLAVPINSQPSTVALLFYFYIHKTELRAEIERLTGLLGINGAPLTSFTAGQLFQNSTSHASDVEELQKKLREAEKLMVECTRYG